jgi:hypothetical protein
MVNRYELDIVDQTGPEIVHIGDKQDPMTINTGYSHSPFPVNKEKPRGEVIHVKPVEDLVVQSKKTAKLAIRHSNLGSVDQKE